MSFFKSMLQDGENNSWSSKRIITFIAFLLCALAFCCNLFLKYTVEEYMFQGMMMVVIAGLGVTVTEKFATKNYSKTSTVTSLPKQHDREI